MNQQTEPMFLRISEIEEYLKTAPANSKYRGKELPTPKEKTRELKQGKIFK